MEHIMVFFAGYLLDLLFGDPYWLPHPVVLIGKIISKSETFLRKECKNERDEQRAGAQLVFLVLVVTLILFGGALYLLERHVPLLAICFKIFLTYQVLATKSLVFESKKVQKTLISGTIIEARKQVANLVGRDTDGLDHIGVTKATVETVAENTVDGVVAPLFYMAIGGPVLGILYKAVNTMDSMVGYKNEKYLHFGRAAAKFDDFCNYIPARLTAILMIFSAFILKLDGKGAYKVWKRDRRKHASPNSAQTESVCAGALGIQLAGDAIYFGNVVKKPFIGDKTRDIISHDIEKACKLLLVTSGLAVVFFTVILWIIYGLN